MLLRGFWFDFFHGHVMVRLIWNLLLARLLVAGLLLARLLLPWLLVSGLLLPRLLVPGLLKAGLLNWNLLLARLLIAGLLNWNLLLARLPNRNLLVSRLFLPRLLVARLLLAGLLIAGQIVARLFNWNLLLARLLNWNLLRLFTRRLLIGVPKREPLLNLMSVLLVSLLEGRLIIHKRIQFCLGVLFVDFFKHINVTFEGQAGHQVVRLAEVIVAEVNVDFIAITGSEK